jgi:cholesterol transport system auxiliary component
MTTKPFVYSVPYGGQLVAAAFTLALLGGCELLRPTVTVQPKFYGLSTLRNPVTAAPSGPRAPLTAPTLMVSPAHAAAGFDSHRMMYLRHPDQLEHFAQNEWTIRRHACWRH